LPQPSQGRPHTGVKITFADLLAHASDLSPFPLCSEIESGLEVLERVSVVSALGRDRPKDSRKCVARYPEPMGPSGVFPGVVQQRFTHVEDH
jgi:hypothetical protein